MVANLFLKKNLKKAKKGGAMYMKADFNKAIDEIPVGLFKDEANGLYYINKKRIRNG